MCKVTKMAFIKSIIFKCDNKFELIV
jgi:hypothetical protein